MNISSLYELLAHLNTTLLSCAQQLKVTSALLPSNAGTERTKFLASWFAGKYVNPQFTYPDHASNLQAVHATIKSLNLTKQTEQIGLPLLPIQSFANSLSRATSLVLSRGTSTFATASLEAYGCPTSSLVEVAQSIVEKSLPAELVATIDSNTFSEQCAATLVHYALDNWKVVRRNTGATRLAVKPWSRIIYVRQDAMFSISECKCLLVHEIGTHVLRAENGHRQNFYPILARGLHHYIATEEGLAVFNETQVVHQDDVNLRQYALRVLAVNWAIDYDFYTTFSKLTAYMAPEPAFDLTLRVKRGLENTELPGSFTKDYLYLAGWMSVQKYVDDGGDTNVLYVGKIGLDDISVVAELQEIGLINPPIYLPRL